MLFIVCTPTARNHDFERSFCHWIDLVADGKQLPRRGKCLPPIRRQTFAPWGADVCPPPSGASVRSAGGDRLSPAERERPHAGPSARALHSQPPNSLMHGRRRPPEQGVSDLCRVGAGSILGIFDEEAKTSVQNFAPKLTEISKIWALRDPPKKAL